jgi:DNA-binding Xre family transcriptional regulator
MEVKIRLKKFLADHDLDEYGIIGRIAADINVNRHTIAKLYGGKTPTVSLDLLSRLCTWLQNQNVRAEDLPGELFSIGRTALWEAIASRQERVTLYLGEYRPTTPTFAASRWISTRDSAVASIIIQQLSTGTETRRMWSGLSLAYVPFRYAPGDRNVDRRLLDEDAARAKRIYARVMANRAPGTTIIVGSQRVNYLLELFVADLFGCPSFVTPPSKPAVPFFSVYRQTDQNTPSCFGGRENPFRHTDRSAPGLHFLSEKGRWVTCPWIEGRQDSGIIISVNDHRNKSVTLAVFGFSGLATRAVGEHLVLKEHLFWPPCIELKDMEIGVYICKLTYSPAEHLDDLQEDTLKSTCEVLPLDEDTLKRFLR